MNQDRGIYNFKIDSSKRYLKFKNEIIGIGIIFGIIIGITSIMPMVTESTNKAIIKTDENKMQTRITSEKEIDIENKKLEHGFIEETVYDNIYKRYIDTEYKFYCAVPSNYTAGESIGNGNRIVLISPDTKTLLFIGAVPNKLKLSSKEIMKQYIAEFGDKVDYKASGDNWYVVSKTNENIFYYKKCFVSEDMIRWFEFNVKDGSNEPLDKYIDYIEDNFKME